MGTLIKIQVKSWTRAAALSITTKYNKGQALYIRLKHYCFPSPQTLVDADRDVLVAMQFSKQKINYIYNISEAFCTGELNRTALLKLDKDQQMYKLLAIKGIGPWTANYVSMKSLRDMTCIAYGDTGLSSALHRHFKTDKTQT